MIEPIHSYPSLAHEHDFGESDADHRLSEAAHEKIYL